jgi:hypothetical protein
LSSAAGRGEEPPIRPAARLDLPSQGEIERQLRRSRDDWERRRESWPRRLARSEDESGPVFRQAADAYAALEAVLGDDPGAELQPSWPGLSGLRAAELLRGAHNARPFLDAMSVDEHLLDVRAAVAANSELLEVFWELPRTLRTAVEMPRCDWPQRPERASLELPRPAQHFALAIAISVARASLEPEEGPEICQTLMAFAADLFRLPGSLGLLLAGAVLIQALRIARRDLLHSRERLALWSQRLAEAPTKLGAAAFWRECWKREELHITHDLAILAGLRGPTFGTWRASDDDARAIWRLRFRDARAELSALRRAPRNHAELEARGEALQRSCRPADVAARLWPLLSQSALLGAQIEIEKKALKSMIDYFYGLNKKHKIKIKSAFCANFILDLKS